MINTAPEDYIISLTGKVMRAEQLGKTPSEQIIYSLQANNPKIATKGFYKAVLNSILEDALKQEFFDDKYRQKLVTRLERRFGKLRTRRVLIEQCDILYSWKHRNSRFVPDAFLLDAENRTIVCYEVEDSHPLNLYSIKKYADAWWTLNYIYWDIHLITYDIYGHPRIILFPEAGFVATDVHNKKTNRDTEPV